MRASASCLLWNREGVCILLTAHTAPKTKNTGWGGCCSKTTAEEDLTPCPCPSRHVHREFHSQGSLGALVLPGHGAHRSSTGPGCSRLLCCSQDPRQPLALPGPSLRFQPGLWLFLGRTQSSLCYKYPGAGLPARSWLGGVCVLKPNVVSLQLTLWVHDSPLCCLKKRNPLI